MHKIFLFYNKIISCLYMFRAHVLETFRSMKWTYCKTKNFVHQFGYLLTYLLTPWCTVLREKLTGLQLVKKFPTFHGTRRFITALTSVRHLSLSWASPIQSTYPHLNTWRSFLILSTHLRLGLPSGLFRDVSSRNPPPGEPSGGVVYLQIVLYPEQAFRMWVFLNIRFYRKGLLTPRPTRKLEDRPLSAVRDCLFNLFAATLLIGSRSSIRNMRTRHAVVTGTHYIAWLVNY